MTADLALVVTLVLKHTRHSDVLESTGGVELFSLHATTSGEPGVIIASTLPGVHRTTFAHQDRYGKGMKLAARECVDTYRNWITDNLGVTATVRLVDTAGTVLWCSHCASPHPPAILVFDEGGDNK
jgi:hypothetical protein